MPPNHPNLIGLVSLPPLPLPSFPSRHESYRGYAIFMVLVYPVGITMLFSGLLYANREAIHPTGKEVTEQMEADAAQKEEEESKEEKEANDDAEEGDTDGEQGETHEDLHVQAQLRVRAKNAKLKRISFLYESYLPHLWFFEILECLRRLAMTGALSGERV